MSFTCPNVFPSHSPKGFRTTIVGVGCLTGMRAIWVILLVGIGAVFAASEFPSVQNSDAVLKGTVISNTMVRFLVTDDGDWVWKAQLWRAEVEVFEVIKEDWPVGKRVSLYYRKDPQAERRLNGLTLRSFGSACPLLPNVSVGITRTFYCVRGTTKEEGGILLIPEDRWMEDTPRPSP